MRSDYGFFKPSLNYHEEFEALFQSIYKFKRFLNQLHISYQKDLITLHNDFLTGAILGDYSAESLRKIESILLQTAYIDLQKRCPTITPVQAVAQVRHGTI